MKKIYAEGFYRSNNEELNEYLIKIARAQKEASEKLSQDNFKLISAISCDYIRRSLGLPDKVLGLMVSDDTNVAIAIYPIESDGTSYETFYDQETKKPYILVEEDNI